MLGPFLMSDDGECQTESDPGLSHLETLVPAMAPRDVLYEAMIILQRKITQCLTGQGHFRDMSGVQRDK